MLLVMLAIAESRRVQQYVRSKTDSDSSSDASASRAALASAKRSARNSELKATLSEPTAQEFAWFASQQIDILLTRIVGDPKLQEGIRALTGEVRAIISDTVLQEQATLVARQLEKVNVDANFQKQASQLVEQAKKLVTQMQTTMMDPGFQGEPMEAIMANPRLHEHARRLSKQLGAISADQNFQDQATPLAELMEALLAEPNFQRHLRRIVAHVETIGAHTLELFSLAEVNRSSSGVSFKTNGDQTEVTKGEASSIVEVSRKFIPPLKKLITSKYIPLRLSSRGRGGDPLRLTTAGTRAPTRPSMKSDPQPRLGSLGRKGGSEAPLRTLYSKDRFKASTASGEVRAQHHEVRPLHAPALNPSNLPRAVVSMQASDNFLEPFELNPPSEEVVVAVESMRQREPEGTRMTAADLSAASGISIDEARLGMKDLAAALAGADGVSVSASSKGDLLYSFPKDVRGQLASRSSAARIRDAWNGVKPVLQGVGRFSFGLALFASIAIIFTAISALQSSSDDRRDRDRDGRGPFDGFGFSYGYSPLDLFFPRPWGYYSYGWFAPPPRMSLPEAIFSFVFGDGEPNVQLRAARVRALADVIRANGGAVVADSLAPFLESPPRPGTQSASYNVDESWVLPAITELGGRPEVADDGTIVYVFDDLTVSAVASDANLVLADPALASLGAKSSSELAQLAAERGIQNVPDADELRRALRAWAAAQLVEQREELFPDGTLDERSVPFSNAQGGQLATAAALGLVNLGGAAYLGTLLSKLPPGVRLDGDLSLLQAAFPFLLAYAVSFIAIPVLRFFRLQATNAQIAERNDNRRAWRDALRRGGDDLRGRLAAARRKSKKLRLVRADDVAYDSAKGLSDQAEQPAFDDFDRRLRDAPGGE